MTCVLVLLLVWCACWCQPTTVVSFSPVGYSPGVAPGFAYAFRAPAPLYSPAATPTGRSLLSRAFSNSIGAPAPVPTIIKTQYHSQDELGQYAFGYVGDASTAHEVRTMDGAVRGSYTYVDSDGELQTANYVADRNGFRVEASNLPQVPVAPTVAVVPLPEPVKHTPEVEAATAAHLRAFAEVKAARAKRAIPSTSYLPPPPPPVHLSSGEPVEEEPRHVPALTNVLVPPTYTVKASGPPVPVAISTPAVHHPHPLPTPSAPVFIPPPSLPAPSHIANTHAVFIKADPQDLHHVARVPLPTSLAAALASPGPVVAPQVLTQFHSQNELGGFEYGYGGGPSSKHEIHTPDGVTRGSYSYIDANGALQTVSYVADDVYGFRVLASNLPEAPADPYQ
ncbi:Cuticle protein 6-like 11 [Homarus americanus]|uniref:Cuticle protein 6-like 11 n=1 Tax=Homarus americanus TaxID=6706 RepID=A0A8J5K166_HOMAM|nr:Cuticle protein 6-like 11 [Homarus americanus]